MYDKKLPAQCKPIASWTKDEFVAEINSKFVYSERTAKIIYYALKYKKHVLFWGTGGHAKSEIVDYALRMVLPPEEYYRDTFITACGGKMRAEQFQGYQSLPAFKEGKMVTVMDQTMFVRAKYAILDELLAAPSQLLLFLRDGISRGELCVDGVCYPVITGNIFACTNINPQTWCDNAGDDDEARSRKALLQRFLYRKEVKWPSYQTENFSHMFINQTGADEPVWAEICQETVKLLPDFSPRTALQGLSLYRTDEGLDALDGFDGISDEVYAMWQKMEVDKEYISQASKIARESKELAEMLALPALTPEQARAINARANGLVNKLGKLKIPKDAKLYENVGDTRRRLLEVSGLSFDIGFNEQSPEPPTAVTKAW